MWTLCVTMDTLNHTLRPWRSHFCQTIAQVFTPHTSSKLYSALNIVFLCKQLAVQFIVVTKFLASILVISQFVKKWRVDYLSGWSCR